MSSPKVWTGECIRHLRCQLGWSRAELSRRLGLDLEAVKALELGSFPQSEELILQLDRMQGYLNDQRQHLTHQPIAEALLRERGISQIEFEEVMSHRATHLEVDKSE